MKIDVYFGSKIAAQMCHFPDEDLAKILAFKAHLEQHGFDGLPGRNKCSDDISPDDPYWAEKVRYVQTHRLWHYHIGIPDYRTHNGFGDYTSEYILHYLRGEGFIKIVDFSAHPPFKLPHETYLI